MQMCFIRDEITLVMYYCQYVCMYPSIVVQEYKYTNRVRLRCLTPTEKVQPVPIPTASDTDTLSSPLAIDTDTFASDT